MATRQQMQIESQQQVLLAKEQRLKFLKQQETRHQQQAGDNEKLRRLRDKVDQQEMKLKKLRALRGQVDQQKVSNSSLTSELDSIKLLFSDKEKELSAAVTKVEELTQQLDELRRGRMGSRNNQPASHFELDRLRKELSVRNQLNSQQQEKLSSNKSKLSNRHMEISQMDKRIEELTQRLKKKRAMNQQLIQQVQLRQLNKNRGRPISANIAAVEPFLHTPAATAATPESSSQDDLKVGVHPSDFNKQDPKYQTLPHGVKLSPMPPGDEESPRHPLQNGPTSSAASSSSCKASILPRGLFLDSTSRQPQQQKPVTFRPYGDTTPITTDIAKPKLETSEEAVNSALSVLLGGVSLSSQQEQKPTKQNISSSTSDTPKSTTMSSTSKTTAPTAASAAALAAISSSMVPQIGSFRKTKSTEIMQQQPPTTSATSNGDISSPPTSSLSSYQPRCINNPYMSRLGTRGMEQYMQNVSQMYSKTTSKGDGISQALAEQPAMSSSAIAVVSPSTNNTGASTDVPQSFPFIKQNRNRRIEIPAAFSSSDGGEEVDGMSSYHLHADSDKVHFKPSKTRKRHSYTEPEPGSLHIPEGTAELAQSAQQRQKLFENQKPDVVSMESITNVDKELVISPPPPLPSSSPPVTPPVPVIVHDELADGHPAAALLRTLKPCLKQGKEPHKKGRVSFDPLALLLDASLEGELDLVMKTAGEVVNASEANDEGITALHNAICAGHYDIVKFLVEFGCDVNAQDSDGWTPLHCAASCNNLPMVKFLVVHGACIFATTISDHETAAEKCEEDEEGYDGCSQYLYNIQEKLGVQNNGAVYALYDYKPATDSDEMTFKCGDLIYILRKGDDVEKEWWWGRLKDKEGYVASNLIGLYPRVQRVKKL